MSRALGGDVVGLRISVPSADETPGSNGTGAEHGAGSASRMETPFKRFLEEFVEAPLPLQRRLVRAIEVYE